MVTLSVITRRGRVCEVVETLSCRKVDVYSGDHTLWWQLLQNQGQGHQVKGLLVCKGQRHCWCRSVCGQRVDRESSCGAVSLRQNHLSEAYSWPACSYRSVCVCPTEWSSDEIKDQFFNQLGAVKARIPGFEFLIQCGDWNGHVGRAGTVCSGAWCDGVWQARTRC